MSTHKETRRIRSSKESTTIAIQWVFQSSSPIPIKLTSENWQGYQFAYTKYLEEVVKILESDPKFTERLKNMNEEDIKVFVKKNIENRQKLWFLGRKYCWSHWRPVPGSVR